MERATTLSATNAAGTDLQPVPLAIVERSRGAQLSVVGIRIVHLCSTCRADDIERWQRNRPNALLPGLLPTVDTEG
jgi:hypothetical protein